LAKAVDVKQFGVNYVTLEPGSISALRHWHEAEDEFVYVLSGQVVDDLLICAAIGRNQTCKT